MSETSDPRPHINPSLDAATLEQLFDRLPNVVFFVKDRATRYQAVNRTLLARCGIAHRSALLGRTAAEVFPGPLGTTYQAQDEQVLATGRSIEDRLELHLYPGGNQGWCLTSKLPLRQPGGEVNGLAGISRDLHRPDERHPEYRRLAAALDTLARRYDEPLRISALAHRAGLSLDRFERLVRRVYHLTPRQLLAQTRIDAATRLLLETDSTVSEVAHACGYTDHSAFSRQFKARVGLTPRQLRQRALNP